MTKILTPKKMYINAEKEKTAKIILNIYAEKP